MPPSNRPSRVFAATIFIFLIFFIFHHVRQVPAEAVDTYFPDASRMEPDYKPLSDEQHSSRPFFGSPGAGVLAPPVAEPEDSSEVKPELVENAYRLPTADSFRTHFRAVTQLQGMSVEEAKSSCQWPEMSEVNFQFLENDHEWVKQDPSDAEVEAQRKKWHDFVDNRLVPYEDHKSRFEGRGIVIVAGNEQSLKRVKVVLRALKKLGSNLPIEIHYWADEMTEDYKEDISAMWPELAFNDLSAPSNVLKTNHDGLFINYQLKTAAVVNSRFAEPLLLDSDNIPVMDPTSLFESSVYREYGTLFWPDIARTRPNNPIWSVTNTRCRTYEYEQESGQMIVDKRRYWYHLQLAAWMNNESGEYYNRYLLGDKDTFRFAWHALRTEYGSPSKWLTSVGTIADDGFYCGHSFAQYHPDGGVAFLHGGLIKTMAKEVIKWQRDSRGGVFQVYKKSDYDEQHFINVNVSIKADPATYLPDRPENLAVALCTDFHQVTARPMDELASGFEETFREIGGYWMLDD